MNKYSLYLLALLFLTVTACDDEEDPMTADQLGTMEIEFENVIGPQDNQRSFALKDVGSVEYPYQNGMGQEFNITHLKYYISEVALTGPDGERYEETMSVSATEATGYHLIDASDPGSMTFALTDVPAGRYNKISFLMGVDSTGVLEGAAGGSLDPATSGMFWSWNSGYVAMKIEGQSPASPGGARGNTIEAGNAHGIVYHIGGWKDIPGTPFVYNNQRVELDFDTNARVTKDLSPTAHLEFDVAGIFTGDATMLDFETGSVSVHRPSDAAPLAKNAGAAFRYDHVHQ